MKSRTSESAPAGMNSLTTALAVEAESRLKEYYLPWLEEAVVDLDTRQTWIRLNENTNSIGNLLLHLEGNVRQWILHGLGGEADHRDRDSEFNAKDGIVALKLLSTLKNTVNEACHVISTYDSEEKLLEPKTIQAFSTNAFDAIFHVVEHFSYHTGQIVQIAKVLSGSDLRFYEL